MAGLRRTTLTQGSVPIPVAPGVPPGSVLNGYTNSGIGSLSPSTYTDTPGNGRTVSSITQTLLGGAGPAALSMLLTSGAPNSDDTFKAIVVDGNRLERSAAGFTGPATWSWPGQPVLLDGSGAITVDVEFE